MTRFLKNYQNTDTIKYNIEPNETDSTANTFANETNATSNETNEANETNTTNRLLFESYIEEVNDSSFPDNVMILKFSSSIEITGKPKLLF